MTDVPQFLDPPVEQMPATPRVLVLPAPLEATVSYGGGTADGPAAIIEASRQVELFDEELGREPFRVGVQTLPTLQLASLSSEAAIKKIENGVREILAAGAWPLVFGGEHALTTGCVRASLAKYPKLGVLQIDAHGDLRQEYEGSIWSHASVMRRIVDLGCPTVGVGLRSVCPEEWALIRERRLPRWFAHQIQGDDTWMDGAIAALPEEIFLTIDVDGLDPSLIRATGTPEPGGLGWYPCLRFLKKVFAQRRVVGADVVELAPVANDHASSFTVARLAYKVIGYFTEV